MPETSAFYIPITSEIAAKEALRRLAGVFLKSGALGDEIVGEPMLIRYPLSLLILLAGLVASHSAAPSREERVASLNYLVGDARLGGSDDRLMGRMQLVF